jgi:glycerophosphoryl diester phosphodiesterase
MAPELKEPSVRLPFNGVSREQLAQRVIDEYRAAGVAASDVLPQSFDRRDVEYWIRHEPDFGEHAVLLDNVSLPITAPRAGLLRRYKAAGINAWAPPLFVLLDLDADGRIVPSRTARAARGGGARHPRVDARAFGQSRCGDQQFYRTIDSATTREGDVMEVMDVLAREVGVRGIFSDWPATVSFYAGCADLL